jgi:hypothetical protein
MRYVGDGLGHHGAQGCNVIDVTERKSTGRRIRHIEGRRARAHSLQLRVLGFSFFQDGDVGVGVPPESEEIFVGDERTDAGGIGICSLRSSRLQGIGPSHSQMRQRSRPAVPDDSAVVENLLKLGGGSAAISGCQVCISANVRRVEAGDICDESNLP